MRNKLDVLCIDGIMGVGKTTQVIILRNLLKSHNIPHKIISFEKTREVEFTKKQLLKIEDYLEKEPDGVVLCDGSIAIDIVDDIANNMHREELWAKHKDNVQIYESLNTKFNFVNVLLTPNNLDLCDRRLQKKANMSGEIKTELPNREKLKVVIQGLRQFDHSMLTLNLKFNYIDLDGNENIMDIHENIKQIIVQRYQIKNKKPT